MPASLVSGGVHDIWIRGIDCDIIDTGVLADVDDFLPGLAGIGRLIKTAITTCGPQRTLSSDKHNVAVTRIDGDASDVLRVLQAKILPALAAIFRTINAVTV